jgi:dihydrolipoamide dehydrogenase
MKKFDLCIIGGGPSGYAAAMRAMDYGKRTAIIERGRIGGAGIWNGALSSKTLWELSVNYTISQSQGMGFRVYDSELIFSEVISQMNQAVHEKYTQLKTQIDYFQRQGLIEFFNGHGKLKTKNEIEIGFKDNHSELIWADNTILAIGSRPRYIPNIEIDEKIILSSDGISSLEDFPESMVILGAGVIGSEFATVFSNFGKTKVYIIDKQDKILPFEDRDLANIVSNNLQNNGVTIHHGANLERMDIIDGKVEYEISIDGRKEIYNVEKALISVGRVPNIENLGLEDIGIKINERGYCIDDDTQTCVDNIYAVGDFTADIALVNVGELEGRYAVERIFGNPLKKINYDNISTIMFLNPAIAGVGFNETKCREMKIPYKVATMHFKYVNRAIAMRKTEGLFKILVTDDENMNVLGMRACGKHASSTIESIALLIDKNLSIRELAELIHPHPSITEGIQECARMLCGKSIIKPEIFNMDLKCYRVSEDGRMSPINYIKK